jgi:hypothetical protein
MNNTYAPTYAIDSILAAYDVQCLFDSTAQTHCYPIVSGYNTTGGLLNLPTNELCTYCTLETLNVTLSNPITFNYPLRDLLSSAISKCGPYVTSFSFTKTRRLISTIDHTLSIRLRVLRQHQSHLLPHLRSEFPVRLLSILNVSSSGRISPLRATRRALPSPHSTRSLRTTFAPTTLRSSTPHARLRLQSRSAYLRRAHSTQFGRTIPATPSPHAPRT